MNKQRVIKIIRDAAAFKRAAVPLVKTKELSYACRAMAVALEDLVKRLEKENEE